jgi:hypothetical protein
MRGDRPLPMVGFPEKDVFVYEQGVAESVWRGKVDWSQLRLARIKEAAN